jgi:acyl-CoA reductase-like NAD-dependent aldehyde dehydrogenase
MRRSARGCFVGGAWIDGTEGTVPVIDKYSGEVIGEVDQASRAQVEAAVAAHGDRSSSESARSAAALRAS